MRWARHIADIGEKRNAYRISAGKPEGKIVNTVMKLRVP
jgi:hypothetical protein